MLSPQLNISRFISGHDSAWAGGKRQQADQLQHILLSTEAERRHRPHLVGLSIHSGVDEQSNLSGKLDELQVQTLSQGRIYIQNYRGKRWSQEAVPAPSSCVSLPRHCTSWTLSLLLSKKGLPQWLSR